MGGLGSPLVGTLTPLGMGRSPAIVYLLLDQFTTQTSAPLASPRTCEPGPGALTLVQVDGQFSINSSGKLVFPSQATPNYGDLGFYTSGFARVAVRTLITELTITTAGFGFPLAWATSQTLNFLNYANLAHAFFLLNQGLWIAGFGGGAATDLGITLTIGTAYQLAISLLSTGAVYLIKGGAYASWTTVYTNNTQAQATIYPAFSNYSTVGLLDNFRLADVPTLADLGDY